MSSVLVEEKNRLSGNSMGRSVMKTCSLHRMIGGKISWRERVSKDAGAENLIQTIVEETDKLHGRGTKRKRGKGREA